MGAFQSSRMMIEEVRVNKYINAITPASGYLTGMNNQLERLSVFNTRVYSWSHMNNGCDNCQIFSINYEKYSNLTALRVWYNGDLRGLTNAHTTQDTTLLRYVHSGCCWHQS